MPKKIRMPKLSDTMEEGSLIAWRKSVGDAVQRGEILAEIETDKADMEFESYTEGIVHSLLVEPGATVAVGTLIAIIQLPGETPEDVEAALGGGSAPVVAAAPATARPSAPAPAPEPPGPRPLGIGPTPAAPAGPALPAPVAGERVVLPSLDEDRLRATPRARRLADEKSIDLTEVEGTGPGGAILFGDIEGYLRELESQVPDPDTPRATPLALRMASDLDVDVELVKGSGPAGRITKSDVLGHLTSQRERDKDREAEIFRGVVQLSQKRKALIRNMVRSKEEAPHFYVQMDVRTGALKRLRERLNEDSSVERPRLSYTHLVLKACALALERFPDANATYRPDDQAVAIFDSINIGLAVDVNDELVAPTIKSCQGKGVFQLAGEAATLIQRARMRKLQPADYADGTFTISNLGMFGVDQFYAIITPPQSSILAVSAIEERPIVEDGALAVGLVTTLGLSVDHRVLDGAKASRFLGEIRRLLEAPEELLRDDVELRR